MTDREEISVLLAKHGFKPTECWSGVGAGWIPLVEELIVAAKAINFDTDGFFQIKQKFGRLTVYHTDSDEMRGLVDVAVEKSARTCELCGAAGRDTNTSTWMNVLCADCETARKERKHE